MGRLLLTTGISDIPELEFVASGNGTDADVTIPVAGRRSGNFCVAFLSVSSAGDPGNPTLSGFTNLQQQSSGSVSNPAGIAIACKLLDGSETTITVDSEFGHAARSWIVLVFRPRLTYASFAGNSGGTELTNSNPSSQTIAASGESNLPIVLLGHMRTDSNPIDPRSVSPAMTEVEGPSTSHYAHYKIYTSEDTPANHSYDMDDEGGANGIQSVYADFAV